MWSTETGKGSRSWMMNESRSTRDQMWNAKEFHQLLPEFCTLVDCDVSIPAEQAHVTRTLQNAYV